MPAGRRDPEVGRMSPSNSKATAAIIGPGNIGTDLLAKLRRSESIEVQYVVGVVESDGLQRARSMGIEASAEGLDWLLSPDRAAADRLRRDVREGAPRGCAPAGGGRHRRRRPDPGRGRAAGLPAGELPRARRRDEHQHDQLRRPGDRADRARRLVASSRCPYAEIVASVASKSAGPGTRANIDEFTHTTVAGGARARRDAKRQGDHRPQPGRAADDHARHDLLRDPGRRRPRRDHRIGQAGGWPRCRSTSPATRCAPSRSTTTRASKWDGNGRVTVFIEVLGAGDYLPTYAGNLDIMTAAAARVGELVATHEVRRSRRMSRHRTPGPDHRHDACATAATRCRTSSPRRRCGPPCTRSTAPASR